MWPHKLAKNWRRWKMRDNVFHSKQQNHCTDLDFFKTICGFGDNREGNLWWIPFFFPKIIIILPVIRLYISTSLTPALVMDFMWLVKVKQGDEPLMKRNIKCHVLLWLSQAQHGQINAASSVWIPQWSRHQGGSLLIQSKWKAGISNKLAFYKEPRSKVSWLL